MCSVAAKLYVSTWTHSKLHTCVVQGAEPNKRCWSVWETISSAMALLQSALTGASLFFRCSGLKQRCAWVRVRDWEEGDGFRDPRRLCECGPERLSNKHTQSLNGFLKKDKEKPRSIYITEEMLSSVSALFVSSTSHSLTATCFNPSQQDEAVFSTMINSLNSMPGRVAKSHKYH